MRTISNESRQHYKRKFSVCERTVHDSGLVWYPPLGRPHNTYESALNAIPDCIRVSDYKIKESDLVIIEHIDYILPCVQSQKK